VKVDDVSKSYALLRARRLAWIPPAGVLLALSLSASAAETPSERCERATNAEAAIEACSSAIQTDKDRHRLAMSYFNRAGWYLKKDDVNRAESDLSEAIGLEPDFAAALTKRGLVGERRIFDATWRVQPKRRSAVRRSLRSFLHFHVLSACRQNRPI